MPVQAGGTRWQACLGDQHWSVDQVWTVPAVFGAVVAAVAVGVVALAEPVTLIRFRSQNHPQQQPKDEIDDRGTTWDVFDPLHDRFRFTVDVAAATHNTKLPRYYTRDEDGLTQSWAGERVWCNPPYSDIRSWVAKAWDEWRAGCPVVVMLLPANRTEQGWWQDLVEPYRDRGEGLRVEFLRGRMRFDRPGVVIPAKGDRPPFGSCLAIWGDG